MDDHGICGWKAVKDGSSVFGNLGGSKAKASGDYRVDLEAGGGSGDGIVNAVLGIDNAGDLLDGSLDAGAKLVEEGRIVREQLDDNVFRLVREIADHVLQNLDELGVECGLGFEDTSANVGHDLVNGPATLAFQADGEVTAIGLGDGSEPKLEAGTTGGDLYFGRAVENLLDVSEDAVGFGERGAGGGQVVQDERAFVHCGQEIGAERVVRKVGGYDEGRADQSQDDWTRQRPGEDPSVGGEDAPHDGAVLVTLMTSCRTCGAREVAEEDCGGVGFRSP